MGIPNHVQAAIDAYVSLIWWINGVGGSLFALNWFRERHRNRIEAWRKRTNERIERALNSPSSENSSDGD